MSRASQGPANRGRTVRSRPVNRARGSREADRIKATRAGWASPATAVRTYWRSGPLPVPVAGFAAGLWASLTGLAITVVLTLLVWIFAAGESASNTAMRVGADIWLVAHGTPFVVGTGVWSLLPWAWVVFPGLALWGAGRWLAHRAAIAYPKSAFVAAACLALAYSLVALLAALFGTLSGAGAVPVRAVLHAGALAFVVALVSIIWRARLADDMWPRAWRLAKPAVGALAALAIGAGLVLAAALIAGHSAMLSAYREVDPGLVGSAALFVAWLGYVPAALMWSLSFAMGTGVSVAQTVVTPVSPLPERIDLMGMDLLPTTLQWWWLVGALIPVAAGVVLTRLCPPADRGRDWLLPRAAAVAIVLVVTDVWWAVSVGSLGEGRLGIVGPPPTAIMAVVVGVVLGILGERGVLWARRRWSERRHIDLTDEARDDVEASDPQGTDA